MILSYDPATGAQLGCGWVSVDGEAGVERAVAAARAAQKEWAATSFYERAEVRHPPLFPLPTGPWLSGPRGRC